MEWEDGRRMNGERITDNVSAAEGVRGGGAGKNNGNWKKEKKKKVEERDRQRSKSLKMDGVGVCPGGFLRDEDGIAGTRKKNKRERKKWVKFIEYSVFNSEMGGSVLVKAENNWILEGWTRIIKRIGEQKLYDETRFDGNNSVDGETVTVVSRWT